MANIQLKTPKATASVKFHVRENVFFFRKFVVLKKVTVSIIGLHFIRHNSPYIDTAHGVNHFLQLYMQVKTATSESGGKPEAAFIDGKLTIPPIKTNTITIFVDPASDIRIVYNGLCNPIDKLTETSTLLISYSESTKIDKK